VLYHLSYEGDPTHTAGWILVGREGVEPPNGVPELIYSQRPLATWIPAQFVIADCGLPILDKKINNQQSSIYYSRKPTMGIEPITYHLQGGCSAD
jgi:hypothetical protein